MPEDRGRPFRSGKAWIVRSTQSACCSSVCSAGSSGRLAGACLRVQGRRRGPRARRASATRPPRSGRRRSRTRTPRAGRRGTGRRSGAGRTSWPVSTAWSCADSAGEHVRRRGGAGSGCSRGTRRTGSRPAAASATRCAVGGGDAVRLQARRSACAGSVAASPMIISVKKMPIESTCAEFWNVWFIAPPAPRSPGGRLFITAARLGEANSPIETPIRNRISAEGRVGEVRRQQQQQPEADRRQRASRRSRTAARRSGRRGSPTSARRAASRRVSGSM